MSDSHGLSYRTVKGVLRSVLAYSVNPFQAARLKRFYRPFIQPEDLCFDIGAHVGNRMRAFVSLGARVVALEPQPDLVRLLRFLYGRNPQVILLQSAVGALQGRHRMLISRNAPTVSSLSPDWVQTMKTKDPKFTWVEWQDAIDVEVTTLDALIAQHGLPAFCKIDVEGYELEVLRGLSQPIPSLSFEYIRSLPEAAVECLKYLLTLGEYEFNLTKIEETRFMLPFWVEASAIHDQLYHLPEPCTSGDVYARLKSHHA